ncbi:MAG: hypothetical protein REI94_10440 [Moraxellaceae bacterium]|nr:hypothetical protein [Moraxellaceae bacterium]
MATAQSPDIPQDPLAELATADVQQQAARLAQEAFGAAFRLGMESDETVREARLARIADGLREWTGMDTREGSTLRMAMMLAGLDQWGLAYAPLYGAGALTGLSLLLDDLRSGLGEDGEVHCQVRLTTLQEDEGAALAWKIALRRGIHLALWHTMIAAESQEDALALARHLRGLLLALDKGMPQLGWRLVADVLANVQILCLAHGLAATGVAQEANQWLFANLAEGLPKAQRDRIMAHATEAVLAWQASRSRTD